MASKEESIEVVVLVSHAGEISICPADETSVNTARDELINRIDPNDKEAHKANHTYGGVVKIKVLSKDWHAMQKTYNHE
jgi:hypothetical protein